MQYSMTEGARLRENAESMREGWQQVLSSGSAVARRWPVHTSISSFLADLRAERQASSHTLRSYRDDVEIFSRYLEENQKEGSDPTIADPARLRRYSAWLRTRLCRLDDCPAAGESAVVLSLFEASRYRHHGPDI